MTIMRRFTPGRLALSVLFFASALIIVWLNYSWLVVNPPYTYDTQRGAGTVHYSVSRSHMRPGDCVTFAWQVDHIQAVYFDGVPEVGTNQREVCASGSAQQLPKMALEVVYSDQISVTYTPLVAFDASINVTLPLALIIIGIAILVAPIEASNLFQRVQLVGSMVSVVGLSVILAVVVLFLLGSITTVKAVDDYINQPWYSVLDSSRCGYIEVSPYSTRPERIMYDQLSRLDNAQGQILVFGTSNAVESYLPYDLNAYEQSHILNLAMGASTPLEYNAVLKYLDEQKDILHPKQGKTAIVLAFWSAVFAKNPWHYLYDNAFRLYDLYDLQEKSTIDWTLTPTNNALAPILMAQARTQSLIARQVPTTLNRNLFPDTERALINTMPSNCRPQNPAPGQLERVDFWRQYHGGDDYVLPNEATVPLEEMAQRANAAGVPIILIDLPLPTWLRSTVYQQKYMAYMEDFAARYHASVYDLSALLPDTGFRDTAHPAIDGRHTLTESMLNIFKKEGLLPAEP